MSADRRRKQRAAPKSKKYKQRAAPKFKKRNFIPGHTPEQETASELGVSVRTLRKWRQTGQGPPYIEVGRQIHYRDESRAAWLKGREVQPVRSNRTSSRRQSNKQEAYA